MPASPFLTPIVAFADHDRDRGVVTRACRRAAAELLQRMDLVTSPGGLDEMTGPSSATPPEVAAEYLRFRAWFGGFVTAEFQGLIGRVLQACTVDRDGLVRVQEKLLAARPPPSEVATLASRLQWLVDEIPSLQDHYHQLYEAEARDALALCARIDAMDLGDPQQLEEARELWPQLDLFYLHAQKGARICRHDDEAVGQARTALDRLAAEVAQEEAELERQAGIAAGSVPASTAEELADALRYVTQQVQERQAKVARLEEAQRQAQVEIGELLQQRNGLLAKGAAA